MTACQAHPETPTAPPLPTPFPEIATTPSFQSWVIQSVLDFRQQSLEALPVGFGVQVESLPPAVQQVSDRQLVLLVSSAAPPEEWFVTPLGWEGIVFAVNPENRVRRLSSEQLAAIFSGQVADWEQLDGTAGLIEPIIPLEGDELRDQLANSLLEGRRFTPAAMLGPTPELTLTMIDEHPGAIAILPLSALTSAARALVVDGAVPSTSTVESGQYPFRVELLAYAPQEPDGQVRLWLAWLQAQD